MLIDNAGKVNFSVGIPSFQTCKLVPLCVSIVHVKMRRRPLEYFIITLNLIFADSLSHTTGTSTICED